MRIPQDSIYGQKQPCAYEQYILYTVQQVLQMKEYNTLFALKKQSDTTIF